MPTLKKESPKKSESGDLAEGLDVESELSGVRRDSMAFGQSNPQMRMLGLRGEAASGVQVKSSVWTRQVLEAYSTAQ